jgi:hypothetical protein
LVAAATAVNLPAANLPEESLESAQRDPRLNNDNNRQAGMKH